MPNTKPFVQVACVCEKVLIESGNVPTIVRMVDTFNLNAPKDMPAGALGVTEVVALVGVKSGDVTGTHTVKLVLWYPDGKSVQLAENPATLNGGEHGHLMRYQLQLQVADMGLHWIDVLWDDEELTRIPFKLLAATPETTS
jgi:hypothetical protein